MGLGLAAACLQFVTNTPFDPHPRFTHPLPPFHTQGTYEALLTGDKLDLTTDGLGAFDVDEPQLAAYRFSPALPGSVCKDAVTGAVIRFPLALYVPPVKNTAITSVALLTVPAAADPTVTRLYGGKVTDGRAPPYLWTHAYKLFGYDADVLGVRVAAGGGACFFCSAPNQAPSSLTTSTDAFSPNNQPTNQPTPQVNFLTYEGTPLTLGHPISAAVAGTTSAVMAVYVSSLELIKPLVGGRASADGIAEAVVRTTYTAANVSWAATGDGSRALVDAPTLSVLYAEAYTAALPTARRRLRAAPAALTAEQLKPVFDAVAKVVGGTNGKIQALVAAAKAAAASGAEFDAIKALVQITSIAAVQQMELAAAVSDLAVKVAGDASFDVTAAASKLEQVRLLVSAALLCCTLQLPNQHTKPNPSTNQHTPPPPTPRRTTRARPWLPRSRPSPPPSPTLCSRSPTSSPSSARRPPQRRRRRASRPTSSSSSAWWSALAAPS